MKQPVADFVETHLFAKDDSLLKKMEAYYHLKYEVKEDDRTRKDKQKLEKLSIELADIIDGVSALNDKNAIHKKSLNSIFTRKNQKEKLLFEYITSVENRYQYFRKQEQNFAIKELTSEERKGIEKSIASNIQSVEGNVAFEQERKKIEKIENPVIKFIKSMSLKNSLSYDLYFNSEEEFFARKFAKQNRLKDLEQNLECKKMFGRLLRNEYIKNISIKLLFSKEGNSILTRPIKREMTAISSQIKLEENLYKKHLATKNLRNNPDSLKCKLDYIWTSIGLMFTPKVIRNIK
jgi:hypothetical protein